MARYKDYEVLVGTYEEYVLGFRLTPQLKSERKYELLPSFSVKAHCGPVRCLTAGSRFAVSGGSDENCKIFDMVRRVEHGVLDHHEGTVSGLVTHGPSSHIITASDDNSLGVVKMGSWQLEKSLYKHSAGITALAIHPSGKLAFSAAKDKKMITWNLVKARPAFISNIKGIAELLVVSPDGCRYAVGLHRRIDIYSMENAAVEYSIDLKSRPNCLVFLSNDVVVVGGESPRAQVHSLIEKREITSWECHETRVRCMTLISGPEAGAPGLLVTASSSDHLVKVWDVASLQGGEREADCVGSVDTACRVTALTVWHPNMTRANKKKKNRKTEDANNDLSSPPAKKAREEVIINDDDVEGTEQIDEEVKVVESKENHSKKKS